MSKPVIAGVVPRFPVMVGRIFCCATTMARSWITKLSRYCGARRRQRRCRVARCGRHRPDLPVARVHPQRGPAAVVSEAALRTGEMVRDLIVRELDVRSSAVGVSRLLRTERFPANARRSHVGAGQADPNRHEHRCPPLDHHALRSVRSRTATARLVCRTHAGGVQRPRSTGPPGEAGADGRGRTGRRPELRHLLAAIPASGHVLRPQSWRRHRRRAPSRWHRRERPRRPLCSGKCPKAAEP